MKTYVLIVSLLCLAGCSPKSFEPEASGPGDASVATATAADAETPDAGDASSEPVFFPPPPREQRPLCIPTCETATDCSALLNGSPDAPNSPLTGPFSVLRDDNNWACEDQHCVHLGCQNTQECQTEYGPLSICVPGPHGSHYCEDSCETAADCPAEITDVHGEPNWACVDKVCVFQGYCSTNQECDEAFVEFEERGLDFVCVNRDCVKACSSAADCVEDLSAIGLPLLAEEDEDNYRCVDGLCEYQGCISDSECSSDSVCDYFW